MSTPVLFGLAALYALAFWSVAVYRPRWALMLILAATPFQNDVSFGGPLRFSLAEVNLLLTLPVLLVKSRRFHFGPTLLPACLYLAVCVFSTLGQWRASTLQSLVQVGVFTITQVVVFASLARDEEDYRLAFNGLIVVALFLAVSVFTTGNLYIYGLHKNGIGASLASTFVISLELWLGSGKGKARFFYLAASVVIAMGCLVTVSRGAWMTAIVGTLAVLAIRGRIGLAFKCSLVLIPLVAVVWRFLPESSREYATGFGEERFNIKARYDSIDYAMGLFKANPIQGAGMGLRKDYDATNVIVLCLAETGVPGLIAFLVLNASVVFMVVRVYRRVPPQSLSASVLAIALGLILGKFMHGLVDHYWSRGSLTTAWATVGMSSYVVVAQRRRRRLLARARALQAQSEELLAASSPEATR